MSAGDAAESAPASLGHACVSAPRYRGAEDIWVVSVVVAPLELSDVKRKILAADLVVTAHDAAFQERPETIDSRGMYCAVDVFASGVIDGLMVEQCIQPVISLVFIAGDKANLFGDCLADESVQDFRAIVRNDASHDVTTALHGSSDYRLGNKATLVAMLVHIGPADIGFVNLDDSHKFAELGIGQTGADAMAHIVRGRVGTEPHCAMDLQSRDTFLRGQHHVNDLEPSTHPDVRILENRSDQNGKTIAASLGAFAALPMKRFVGDGVNVGVIAARAMRTCGPAARDQVRLAGVIGWE